MFLPASARKSLLMQFALLMSDSLLMEAKDITTFWATIKSALKCLDETFKYLANTLLFTA